MDPLGPQDPLLLGDFTLLARIGAGGMGHVYLGRSSTGRLAAVKVINEGFSRDIVFRERFEREVAAARLVSGAYTAPVVGADTSADRPWMATLYVQGASLQHAVECGGPYQREQVTTLAASIGEALENVHSAGIIHRDLKPANVLMAQDGPRVIDFGIAQAGHDSSLTQTGLISGSPAFMSPEQVLRKNVSVASDVFSLGSLLHFAATGRSAFGGGDPMSVMYALVNEDPDLSALSDPAVHDLVERCLAKDPAQRPSSGQVRADAVEILQSRQGAWEAGELYRPGLVGDDLETYLHPRPTVPLVTVPATAPLTAQDTVIRAAEPAQPLEMRLVPSTPVPLPRSEVGDANLTVISPAPPEPVRRSKGWLVAVAGAVAVMTAAAVVVVVIQFGRQEDDEPIVSDPAGSSSAVEPTPGGFPEDDGGTGEVVDEPAQDVSAADMAMAMSESEAEAELAAQAESDRFVEEDLLGRWVPQVSSKCKGLKVDIEPDWSADGFDDVKHVQTKQILAFHQALNEDWGALTVWPQSLGIGSNSGSSGPCAGKSLWMSIVPEPHPGWKSVLNWCAENDFPEDDCAARKVNGPGGGTDYKEHS